MPRSREDLPARATKIVNIAYMITSYHIEATGGPAVSRRLGENTSASAHRALARDFDSSFPRARARTYGHQRATIDPQTARGPNLELSPSFYALPARNLQLKPSKRCINQIFAARLCPRLNHDWLVCAQVGHVQGPLHLHARGRRDVRDRAVRQVPLRDGLPYGHEHAFFPQRG